MVVVLVVILLGVGIYFLARNSKGDSDLSELSDGKSGGKASSKPKGGGSKRNKKTTTQSMATIPKRKKPGVQKPKMFNSGGCVPERYPYNIGDPFCFEESTNDKYHNAYNGEHFKNSDTAWKIPYPSMKGWRFYSGLDDLLNYVRYRDITYWHGEGQAYGCSTYLQLTIA